MQSAIIREAMPHDFNFVANLMETSLDAYYSGDHRAHAERIFSTHISGGEDSVGHFSFEQKMFIIELNNIPVGMIHIVGKRQGTYKISPIIVASDYRGSKGLGSMLLKHAEDYAAKNEARQMYCTVAEQNSSALAFFLRKGYIIAGRSPNHYKSGITELMLYKPFDSFVVTASSALGVSVIPYEECYNKQARELILQTVPQYFDGIDDLWIDALFKGYKRRHSQNINVKYKLIYIVIDKKDDVLGIAAATPKKGNPIKLMPFVATSIKAFNALIIAMPQLLDTYGHKLYMHIVPSVEETIILQKLGWTLSCMMPGAYKKNCVTQQWSKNLI